MQNVVRRIIPSRNAPPVPDTTRERLTYFANQLGLPIQDIAKSSPLTRRVMTALHLIIDGDIRRGRALLSNPHEKLIDMDISVSGKHAFVYTEMLHMMEVARTSPHVYLPKFLYSWIEDVDSTVYDLLSTVGRSIHPVSVAGVFVHFQAEQRMGQKISDPQVGTAVAALTVQGSNAAPQNHSMGFLRRKRSRPATATRN